MQRIVTYDDLDGTTEATTSVRFAVDDDFLEIDLSTEYADEFTKALAPYIGAALAYARNSSKPGMSKDERVAIANWANANGYIVAPRGRISSEIVEAYNKAMSEVGEHASEEALAAAIVAGEQATENPGGSDEFEESEETDRATASAESATTRRRRQRA